MVSHSIEDAVLLADRILVVADRGIREDIAVPLAHPRAADTAGTRALEERVRALLPGA